MVNSLRSNDRSSPNPIQALWPPSFWPHSGSAMDYYRRRRQGRRGVSEFEQNINFERSQITK